MQKIEPRPLKPTTKFTVQSMLPRTEQPANFHQPSPFLLPFHSSIQLEYSLPTDSFPVLARNRSISLSNYSARKISRPTFPRNVKSCMKFHFFFQIFPIRLRDARKSWKIEFLAINSYRIRFDREKRSTSVDQDVSRLMEHDTWYK